MTHTKIGFDCFQCGKCCNSGPALSISEIFKFKDHFIVGLRYEASYFSVMAKLGNEGFSLGDGALLSLSEVTELKEHLAITQSKFCSVYGTSYVHIYPLVTGYSLDNKQGCEALGHDNLCTLHGDKPLMCQVVPFDGAAPESLQEHRLNGFKKFGCVADSDSDGASKPIVFSNQSITSSNYRRAYDEQLVEMKTDSTSFDALVTLMKDDMPLAPPLESFIEGGRFGKWTEGSPVPLLFTLGTIGKATKDDIYAFVNAQVSLINQEICKATTRKNKNERQRTAVLRNYLIEYERFSQMIEDEHFPWFQVAIKQAIPKSNAIF